MRFLLGLNFFFSFPLSKGDNTRGKLEGKKALWWKRKIETVVKGGG
jgi:hypothetical protein